MNPPRKPVFRVGDRVTCLGCREKDVGVIEAISSTGEAHVKFNDRTLGVYALNHLRHTQSTANGRPRT